MKHYALSYYALLIDARFSNSRRDTDAGLPPRNLLRGIAGSRPCAMTPDPISYPNISLSFAQGFARCSRHVAHYWPTLSTAQLAAVCPASRWVQGCKHGPVRSPSPRRSLPCPLGELTGQRKLHAATLRLEKQAHR